MTKPAYAIDRKAMCFAVTECFGLVLKWRREAFCFSQEALAEEVGVTASAISRMERGHTVPNMVMINMLGRSLGTPGWELLRGAELVAEAVHEADKQAIQYPERHDKGWFPGVDALEKLVLEAVMEKGLRSTVRIERAKR